MNTYYYDLLNKEEKIVYDQLLEGLSQLASSFKVLRLESASISKAYNFLLMDHVELFYCSSYKYQFYPDSNFVEVKPVYQFDKSKIVELKKAIVARINKICREGQGKDKYEQLLYLHDFLSQNVRYDKLRKYYSHHIIGPLCQGVGVCEGIAKSFKMLCDNLGIWCMVVINEPDKENGIKYGHMWNIVKLENNYYHIDVTFDNNLSQDNYQRYDYFMLNDGWLYRDHRKSDFKVPVCSSDDFNYYRKQKLSITGIEDIDKLINRAVRKNETIVFKYRGGYLNKEILRTIVEKVEANARAKKRFGKYRINFAQGVIQVSFALQAYKDNLCLDDANASQREILNDK